MILRRLILLCLTVFFLPPLAASHAETATATYVSSSTLPPELLPAPPAEGSPEWREEVADVLVAQQRTFSEDDLAVLRGEQQLRLDLMTQTFDAGFSATRLPKTYALLNHVLADISLIAAADKQYWHTRRPYLTDSHVKLLVAPPNSFSYPSGHTSGTRIIAEVLGLLLPAKRDELRARAEEIAEHRVEAGVHYPIDLEGGRLLAMLTLGALMRSDTFRQDLAAAHEEIARVRP